MCVWFDSDNSMLEHFIDLFIAALSHFQLADMRI